MANLMAMSWDFLDTAGLPVYFLQSTAQCGVDSTSGLAQTGTSCLVIDSGAFGPIQGMASPGEFYFGTALRPNILTTDGGVVGFGAPLSGSLDVNTRVFVEGDGSVRVSRGNGNITLGSTAAGLITQNAYNYIEAYMLESATVGIVRIWINNVLRLELTGVNTQPTSGGPNAKSTAMQFFGAGGAGAYRHDNCYLNDTTGPGPFNARLGPIEIYIGQPIMDSTPLQFTPSTPGAHYLLVATIPEQIATNVQDATVGQTDQYLYSNANIPDNGAILGLRHELFMGLASAGAGSGGSSVAGAAAPTSKALNLTPEYLSTIYPTNPQTGLSWVKGDLATTPLGPIVVA